VLFKKPPSKVEVLNDFSGEVINFYRVLQDHLPEFTRRLKRLLVSRSEFKRLRQIPPGALTDIKRAVRFYYLLRCSFGGRMNSPTFGTSATSLPKFNPLAIRRELLAAHKRLSRVTIEHLNFLDAIQRYDRPATFFYLDPPYVGHEADYGLNLFNPGDFSRLASCLAGIKGRFLLSLNDVPEVREWFKEFNLEPVELKYTAGSSNAKQAKELFISNYEVRS
jgi:DNA adenine methylase